MSTDNKKKFANTVEEYEREKAAYWVAIGPARRKLWVYGSIVLGVVTALSGLISGILSLVDEQDLAAAICFLIAVPGLLLCVYGAIKKSSLNIQNYTPAAKPTSETPQNNADHTGVFAPKNDTASTPVTPAEGATNTSSFSPKTEPTAAPRTNTEYKPQPKPVESVFDLNEENSQTERKKSTSQSRPAAKKTISSSYEDLINLKKLLDMGVITQDEFDEKKKQILGL